MIPEQHAPMIDKVNASIAALERRQRFLQEKIDRNAGSAGALHFDREELVALDNALRALRLHRADVEGLDDVVLALDEILSAAREGWTGERLGNAIRRAERTLGEWR